MGGQWPLNLLQHSIGIRGLLCKTEHVAICDIDWTQIQVVSHNCATVYSMDTRLCEVFKTLGSLNLDLVGLKL